VFEVADGEFDIAFCGQLAGANLSSLYVLGVPDSVTARISTLEDGVGNEVQRLALAGMLPGEHVTLIYGPLLSQTVEGTNDASAFVTQLENALNQMFGAGSIRVLPTGAAIGQFDIVFGGTLAATKMMPLTVSSELTGSSASIREISVGSGNSVQRLKYAA